MKEQRQRQINTDAIIKVQNFLAECESLISFDNKFSMYQLARDYKLSGAIAGHAIEIGYFVKGEGQGEFIIGSSFNRTHIGAKKLIESLRLKKVKQQHTRTVQTLIKSGEMLPVSKDNPNHNDEDVPKIGRNTGHEIASILKKALGNTQTLNNQSLFSSQEKEYEDKLKIACSVASGLYANSNVNVNQGYTINDNIIDISNDLYNKLKNNN